MDDRADPATDMCTDKDEPISYSPCTPEHRQGSLLATLARVVTADLDDSECLQFGDAAVSRPHVKQPTLAVPNVLPSPVKTGKASRQSYGAARGGGQDSQYIGDRGAPISRGFVVTTAANLPPETLSRVQSGFEDCMPLFQQVGALDLRLASTALGSPSRNAANESRLRGGDSPGGFGSLQRLQSMRMRGDGTTSRGDSNDSSPFRAGSGAGYSPVAPPGRELESRLSMRSLPDLGSPEVKPGLTRTKTHVFTVGPDGRTLRATVSMPPLRHRDSLSSSASCGLALDSPETDIKHNVKGDTDSANSVTLGAATATVNEAKTNGSPAQLKRSCTSLGTVFCQINDCREDLSKAKIYCRRYKICSACIRRDSVVVAGREMRFCQQCSYLHPLDSFDGARHSCREKLVKHAKRVRRCRSSNGRGETTT